MAEPFAVRDGRVVLAGDGDEEPIAIGGGISAEGFQAVSAFCDGHLWAGYLRDAKGIWWFHARQHNAHFVTEDAAAFRVLDDDYGLDSSTVYLENRPIPGSDPASFALVENGTYFARDRNRLYVKDGSHFFHFDAIDMDTLVANGPYVADKDHLFHHGSALTHANYAKDTELVHHSLDGEHDMLLRDWFAKHHPGIVGWWHPNYPLDTRGAEHLSGPWYRTDKAIFFRELDETMRGTKEVFSVVRGAVPSGFEPLDDVHGRDADSAFCRWRRIEGADATTFTALGDLFSRDGQRIYFNGYPVEDADPATFVTFPTSRPFARDQNRVYTRSFTRTSQPFGHPDDVLVPLEGARPATFGAFGKRGAWAADAGGVYLHGERKKKLDAASFRFLCETGTNGWAQDRAGIYRSNGSMTVAGIDGASFRMLNAYWGNDDKAVFSFVTGAIQKSIDAETFEITDSDGGARDAVFIYRVESGAIRKRKR